MIYEKLIKARSITPSPTYLYLNELPSDWDFCKIIRPVTVYAARYSSGAWFLPITNWDEVKITKQQWEQETTSLYLAVGETPQVVDFTYQPTYGYGIRTYSSGNYSYPLNIEFYKLVDQL